MAIWHNQEIEHVAFLLIESYERHELDHVIELEAHKILRKTHKQNNI